MTAKVKPCFGAIPARALLDPNLSLLKLRLLGVIALHDRRGKGQGCWASSTRLAAMLQTNPDVVRRYITTLVIDGYLEREQSVTNKNRRVLRIVYDDPADWAAFTMQGVTSRGHTSADQGVTSDAEGVTSMRSHKERDSEEIAQSAPPALSEPPPVHGFTIHKRHSAEAATGLKASGDDVLSAKADGEFLARVERLVPGYQNGPLSRAKVETVRSLRNRCEEIALAYETHTGDPIGGRAPTACVTSCTESSRATRR
jgi:hypothetical protein